MSFSRHSTYKDSSVEWLRQIPAHWDMKRLRYLSTIRKGRLPAETYPSPLVDSDLPYLSMEFLRGDTDNPNYVPASPNLLLAEPGDILILWDGSNAGEFLRAKRGVVSSTVALIEGMNIEREFLFFACKALERGIKDQTVGMGIPHVSGDELRSLSIPCPDQIEQSQIAAFLDRETAKIDGLVAEQRRLMALLKEKRQAVISHAVTRGLNPDAPMKPSGTEWLGDVPAHWEVSKLSRLVSTRKGIAFKADDFTQNGIPVVKASDIKEFSIRPSTTFLPSSFLSDYNRAVLGTDEIVLSTVGSAAEVRNSAVGQLGLVPPQLAGSLLNQNTVVFSPDATSLLNRFLFFILQTTGYRDHLDLHAHGTANQASLNVSDMLDFQIPLPSLTQQQDIAAHLQTQLTEFDTLNAKAQRAIELLQERRTALISAAVTGQIDVRATATPL